jgi:hypothetical protein
MLQGMELLVTLLFFVGLAVFAPRFGYDSREHVQSNEEKLACLGVAWGHAVPQPLRPPRNRVRRFVARLLLALARWLNPELRAYRPTTS